MSIEVKVYLPGPCEPVSLDDYATYLAMVAGCGTYEQAQCLPDELYYSNPVEGSELSITPSGEER